ncbi:MAG: glycosyltransferase family 2 protein, partial [Thermomicrobiales bacterium]
MSDRAARLTAAVVIPCLDEEASIGLLVGDVQAVASDPSLPITIARILVVDNGSTDRTADVAREAGAEVVPEPRRGYGRACLTGVLAAGDVDLVVLMDGDRSDVPAELPLL